MTISAYGAENTIRIGGRVTGGITAYNGYYVAISSAASGRSSASTTAYPGDACDGSAQPLASGDKIAIRIIGSTVTALHFTPGGGWVQVSATTPRATPPATRPRAASHSSSRRARWTTSAAAPCRSSRARSFQLHPSRGGAQAAPTAMLVTTARESQ